ncbi:MAG: exodeoxyribonuclease VII large subunit [bacterium]|nr:exodeoxyribonuclease VII large subunit [bacterium]
MLNQTFQIPNDGGRRRRKIYSVTELNGALKALIEESFPFVWIFGEISNFRKPASGHFYFTLKDRTSQISAVMFRGQQRHLKFKPEDGMNITGMGRLGVYGPRGTYQIILEYLEPSGIGALQIAFEKLKMSLAEEGCFDDEYKKPLPFLPGKISVMTSPSGAVVHDILKTINRRFANLHIQIMPVKVQGHGSSEEIAAALELLNAGSEAEIVILARGGGSLEDLQAFNSELVARAIFASRIPVVSAVGHATDYTISDFVADLRAPTPTAAAELITPEKSDLQRRCNDVAKRLKTNFTYYLDGLNSRVNEISRRLIDPRRRLADYRLYLDDLCARLSRILSLRVGRERKYLNIWQDRLRANHPGFLMNKSKKQLEQINENLFKSLLIYNHSNRIKTRELTAKLDALNPLAILARGYSVTRTIPKAALVKDSRMVALDQDLEVMLARGRLTCRVKGKSNDGKEII